MCAGRPDRCGYESASTRYRVPLLTKALPATTAGTGGAAWIALAASARLHFSGRRWTAEERFVIGWSTGVPMAEARRLGYLAMDVPEGFSPTLILVLNLAGTFVFGLSGGLAAVRAKL